MRISISIVLLATACAQPREGIDGGVDAGSEVSGGLDAGEPVAHCSGCDSAGTCRSGFAGNACGRGGGACTACTLPTTCVNGVCDVDDAGCFASGVPGAAWESASCPDAGCPVGMLCLRGLGESSSEFGCVPVPNSCAGKPSCECMGCVCKIACTDDDAGTVFCDNGTISRRQFKKDVEYLSDAERAVIARATLAIPLARFRYRSESAAARARLGFMIEDQPTPSPAVESDRMHVDQYGYASMLLATIQQQQIELERLRARIERLEKR